MSAGLVPIFAEEKHSMFEDFSDFDDVVEDC
jgi:hypothetical protein